MDFIGVNRVQKTIRDIIWNNLLDIRLPRAFFESELTLDTNKLFRVVP